jgi:Glycosyl transferase family 8
MAYSCNHDLSGKKMLNFFEWFQSQKLDSHHPWLIFGKGESFALRHSFDLHPYYTLSLNHAVREQPVKVAHIIDLDVVEACGEAILQNAEVLVMPWMPHLNCQRGDRTLAELIEQNAVLRQLDQQGRLLWYSLIAPWYPTVKQTATKQLPAQQFPSVNVRYFSAEAAINLLAAAGVSKIRSLGIDGGATYSQEFADLNAKTLLANQQPSFDLQNREIAKTIAAFNLDYAPLPIDAPIRVFVGCTPSEMLPAKVLEYSIRKRAGMSVTLLPLHQSGIKTPLPKDRKNYPRTPFSFQRFLIPKLCGHQGRGIYLDSDMVVFKNISELWTLPFEGADLLAAWKADGGDRLPQFSVMLLDCAALNWDIEAIVEKLDSGELNYDQLMYEMRLAPNLKAGIDPIWNSLEHYEQDKTALLHYTDMPTQPWVSHQNPHGYLWVRELLEAIEDGAISIDFVSEQIAQGYVRPSLLYQLKHRVEEGRTLSATVLRWDRGFKPPFMHLHQAVPVWKRPVNLLMVARAWIYCRLDYPLKRIAASSLSSLI